jgi:predicted site-specific integrase-resolvase
MGDKRMDFDLPTYVPLKEAAAKYGISLETLRHDVEQGHLRAVKTSQRDIFVANEDVQVIHKRESFWRQVEPLEGKAIGVREARQKYELAGATLTRWIAHGVIRVLEEPEGHGPGHKKLLNERDVAYMSLVADERGAGRGKKILNQMYLPPHLRSSSSL